MGWAVVSSLDGFGDGLPEPDEAEVDRLAERYFEFKREEEDPTAAVSSGEKALLREVAELAADGTLIPLSNDEGRRP